MKRLTAAAIFLVAGAILMGQTEYKRYQDNGDGTVSDQKTALIWQQKDDGELRTWDEANNYCEDLELTGQGDWRLPNKEELLSIVDYKRVNPTIDMDYFPSTKSSFYWSSSDYNYPYNQTAAWSIAFGYSDIYGSISYSVEKRNWPLKGMYRTSPAYVRCVR